MLLIVALYPATLICRDARETTRAWQFLYFFIIAFIAGYLAFAAVIMDQKAGLAGLVAALVFFGVGWFVFLSTHISVATVQKIKAMAAFERYQALHDPLTDLPNRVLFNEHLTHAIRRSAREGRRLAVFIMDLDRFKEVNDTLGHHYGDLLLKEVAPRLRRAVKETDVVARLGGDEFGVLLHDIQGPETARATGEGIIAALHEAFVIEDYQLDIAISIGAAVFPEHGVDADTLMQRADVAMYLAKRGNHGYRLYDPQQDQYTLDRLGLLGELRQAMELDELTLYFQPQYALRTGKVTGVEALLRWPHPYRGLLTPDHFVTAAEQTGLIRPLTQWVLNNALRQCAEWERAGIVLTMSINISIKDLQDPEFGNSVQRGLALWGLDPARLKLEIVETAMMVDPPTVRRVMRELSELGIRFSIDDFAAGYSSLAYLKELPVQELKIDKSFVLNMVNDEDDAVIARAIIDLAHNLSCSVVAEGVENRETFELLEILGCDAVQGHHVGTPMSAGQLLETLRRQQHAQTPFASQSG